MDPAALVRLPPLEVARWAEDGAEVLRAPVTWVDKFGNVQLGAPERDGPPSGADAVTIRVDGTSHGARRVHTFSDLTGGELGLLADANGRLAIVVREGSAASATQLSLGRAVELVW
jgi:S-adenosylmethionine hydrolase